MKSQSQLSLVLVILTIIISTCPLITLSSPSSPRGQKSYKIQCSKNEDCDSRKLLECNLQYYSCDCPKSTAWDLEKRQCLNMEGRPCDPHYHLRHKGQECISNSTCIAGRCQCDDGYLKNGFGLCDLGYNMPCDIHSTEGPRCSWRYMLECPKSVPIWDRKCKCRGEEVDYIWDDERQKCVSLVGTGCQVDGDTSDDKLECVKGGHCVQDRCECLSNYSVTPKRACLLKYGEACDNKAGNFCNNFSFLNCQDNKKCGCEFFGQMAFDEEAQECRMLAGDFCDLPIIPNGAEDENNEPDGNILVPKGDGRTHRCIRDAECTIPLDTHNHHKDKGKGRCTCIPGKFKTEKGNCTSAKGHGLPCSFSGDCNTGAFFTCVINEDNRGMCNCMPNEMFYNGTDCLVLPGRSCSKNKNCGRNSNCENGEYCICNEGYSLDPMNFNCYLPKKIPNIEIDQVEDEVEAINRNEISTAQEMDSKDVTTKDCSVILKGTIEFEKCHCGLRTESHVWDQDDQKCLGLVATPCESDDECVNFSFCDDGADNKVDKSCQCDFGAKTTLNRTCVPKRSDVGVGVGVPVGHEGIRDGVASNSIENGNGFEKLNPTIMKAMSSSGDNLYGGLFWYLRIGLILTYLTF